MDARISFAIHNKVLPDYIYSLEKLTKSTGSRIGKVKKHKSESNSTQVSKKLQDRKEDSEVEDCSKRETTFFPQTGRGNHRLKLRQVQPTMCLSHV